MFHHSGWDDCHIFSYVFRSLQGFPGHLARSLDKEAILGDVLQMLDEHYGIVMTFDAISKELYFLKQGMGENMAKFRVCLSQHVQILQMEYPGRIQACGAGEVALLLKMLAHNVNSENPHSPEDGKLGWNQRPPAPQKP